jgi:hypothetical protein
MTQQATQSQTKESTSSAMMQLIGAFEELQLKRNRPAEPSYAEG